MKFKTATDMIINEWNEARKHGEPVETPPLFLGKPGIGKCLGRGTPVLMADGRQLPVEDIQEGDRVMGPDSEARIVRGVTTGRSPMFRIIPNKGASWECNDVHILTLVNTDTGNIIDIPLNEFLEKHKTFQERHKQFFTGVPHFEGERTIQPAEVSPYFLGLWMGDGTKSISELADGERVLTNVSITKDDLHVIAELKRVAEKWGVKLQDYSGEDRCPTWTFATERGQPNPLLTAMREIVGPDLTILSDYTKAPAHQRLELLAGLIDTDGSLTSGTFEITQKRKVFADIATYIARSLGFRATMKPKVVSAYPDNTYWRVHISGDIERIPTRVPHKQAAPRKQTKDWTRTGFKVAPLGEGDYFGFTVDKDGRFLLGDFTVTHNTSVGEAAANRMTEIMRSENPLAPAALFDPLDLSSILPEDLGGIPFPELDEATQIRYTTFAIRKRLAPFCKPDAYGVIVLDDITQAANAVQIASRQTVLNRRIGDFDLAPNIYVMVTGNRREDKAGASTLPSHFRNSCCILSIEPDVEEWAEWYGKQERRDPVIASFLRYRPSHLDKTPAESDKAGAFATPRSWSKLGRKMFTAKGEGSLEVMRGLVGEGVAVELRGFMNTRSKLVAPDLVLKDPKGALPNPAVLDSPDKAYAMLTGIGEVAAKQRMEANEKTGQNGIKRVAVSFLRAIAWSARGSERRSNREMIAVAVSTYTSNGGTVQDLIMATRAERDDPLIMEALNFLTKAVGQHTNK